MQYKLTDQKVQEEGDIKDQLIETHGYIPTFTINQLQDAMRYNAKALKEATAQVNYEDAVMQNVITHHPFVKDLSDADRRAVYIYEEAFTMNKTYQVKIDELIAQMQKDEQTLADLKEQIPELSEVVGNISSPYVPEVNTSAGSVETQPVAPQADDEIISDEQKTDASASDKQE